MKSQAIISNDCLTTITPFNNDNRAYYKKNKLAILKLNGLFFLFPRRGKMFTGFFLLTRTDTWPQDKQVPFVRRPV